jgi:hypothetical protein
MRTTVSIGKKLTIVVNNKALDILTIKINLETEGARV